MLEAWVLLPTGWLQIPTGQGVVSPSRQSLSTPLTPQYLGGEYELRGMGIIIRKFYLDQESFQEPDTFLKA